MAHLTDREALKRAAQLKEAEQREALRVRLGIIGDIVQRQHGPDKRILKKLTDRKRTARLNRSKRSPQHLTQL